MYAGVYKTRVIAFITSWGNDACVALFVWLAVLLLSCSVTAQCMSVTAIHVTT